MPDGLTESEAVELVRERCAKAGGVRALAAEWGCSPAYVCHVMKGRTPPGAKIVAGLGLERVVRYVPLGRKAGSR